MPSIYALTDPRTNEVRYVGKANNPAERFARHIRECRRRRTPVYNWMRKLSAEGFEPGLIILETCDAWQEAEIKWIAHYRAQSSRLLNLADGGNQPSCTPAQRSENAKKLNKHLKGNDLKNRVKWMKTDLTTRLRKGLLDERQKEKMRGWARDMPTIFGAWANI